MRDVAAILVSILTIATVATVVSRDESGTISTVSDLLAATIRASFGKGTS